MREAFSRLQVELDYWLFDDLQLEGGGADVSQNLLCLTSKLLLQLFLGPVL